MMFSTLLLQVCVHYQWTMTRTTLLILAVVRMVKYKCLMLLISYVFDNILSRVHNINIEESILLSNKVTKRIA